MSIVTPIVVSSRGSGYSNPTTTVSSPIWGSPATQTAGTMRMNTTTGRMETWNGLNWVVVSLDFESRYIKHHIEKAENEVRTYVNTHSSDNVTINDALSEWIGACERFKVIVTLAEHSK